MNRAKIKVIKKRVKTSTGEVTNTIPVMHAETRAGARAVVQGWVTEYRANKEIERQRGLAFLGF